MSGTVFYKVEKITKKEYLKIADENGHYGEEKWLNKSSGGNININPKLIIGYTNDNDYEIAGFENE